LGLAPRPSQGGHDDYQIVAADGADMTAFRDMTSMQPAPLLNLVVMSRGLQQNVNVTLEFAAI
jgi:hypothetical protein